MRSFSGKEFYFYIKYAFVLTFVVFMILYVDWSLIYDKFSQQYLLAFIASQPLQLMAIGWVSWRFSILCKMPPSKFLFTLKAYVLSIGLNSFVPGRLTEVLKITYLQEMVNLKPSTSAAAIVLERIIDALFLGFFMLLGFGAYWIELDYIVMTTICVLFISALCLIPHMARISIKLIDRYRINSSALLFINNTIQSVSIKLRSPEFAFAILLGFPTWLTSLLTIYLILFTIYGSQVSINDTLIIFSGMAVGRAIPGLPGGFGSYEGMIILAMTSLDYSFSESLLTALTMHASQIVGITIGAIIILLKDDIGLANMLGQLRGKKQT